MSPRRSQPPPSRAEAEHRRCLPSVALAVAALASALIIVEQYWCVSYRNGELLAIGSRAECMDYIRVEGCRVVRRLLPLIDVHPTHAMATEPIVRELCT